MPIKPGKDESQKDFVSRCIKTEMDAGTAKDTKQASAMCYSMWREHEKGKSIALSVVLKTDVSAGRVRWKATANSGEFDQQDDKFDESFFDDVVANFWAVQDAISYGLPTPPGFAHPEGMPVPQLDVAHYSFQLPKSERAKARVGMPIHTYRNNRKLVMKGNFETTPLGQAASKSVLEDEAGIIKTSIGVWPDWNRVELLEDGKRVFKGGAGVAYLDHLALTAFPVDAQTEITAEGEMSKSLTARDDALTVIKDEKLVQELEAAATAKSETQPAGSLIKASKTVDGKDYPASDFLVVEDSDKPSTWHLQVKESGKPNHTLMGGAYAALESPGGHRGQKYEGASKAEAVKKLKALYNSEKMDWPGDAKKSDILKSITMGHMGTEFEPEETARILSAMDAQDFGLAQTEIQAAIDHVKAKTAEKPVAESIVTVTHETTTKDVTTVEKDKQADAIDAQTAQLVAQAVTPAPAPSNDMGGPMYESLVKSQSETADVLKTLAARVEALEKSIPNLGAINELATALNSTIEATKATEAQKVKAMLDNRGWLDIGKLYSARSATDNTVDGGVRAKGPQETPPQSEAVGGPIAGKFIKT